MDTNRLNFRVSNCVDYSFFSYSRNLGGVEHGIGYPLRMLADRNHDDCDDYHASACLRKLRETGMTSFRHWTTVCAEQSIPSEPRPHRSRWIPY